jgi:hypothetical protein
VRGLVLAHGVRAFDPQTLGGRQVAVGALTLVAQERDAVPARVGDPLHVDLDDRAARLGRLGFGEADGQQLVEPGIVGQDDLATAVEAQDPRRALEGAEHDDDAPVLAQVGDRLGAAADDVQVRDRALVEHLE